MISDAKDDMRDKILGIALKRFSKYGASKTTMNEIADDLGMSKASLYYYFPDKNALHIAVLKMVGDLYCESMESVARKQQPVEAILMEITDLRQAFFARFRHLDLFRVLRETKSELTNNAFQVGKARELSILTSIFEQAARGGEICSDNIPYVAQLYSNALAGMRMACLPTANFLDDISDSEVQEILKAQKELTSIFIKGLRCG
jgi:TetR/AcrR family transcriptional regulator